MFLIKTLLYRFYFILLFIQYVVPVQSQTGFFSELYNVEHIPSKCMNKSHKAMVFLPDNYFDTNDSFPVVYLLHGYSGHFDDWNRHEPNLQKYASKYKIIIVTPEGNFDRWYINSPIDTMSKYETYIGLEVPQWIDDNYKTKKGKKFRAITGLSMGGHGALTIASDYPEYYGAAGSISGALDLRPFSEKWNLKELLGDIEVKPSVWFLYSFYGKIFRLDRDKQPSIIIDCGESDFFFDVNIKVHNLLVDKQIRHEFRFRPGGHTWDYWLESLPMHLDFFSKFFYE
jgi:S-formylglutathione hydrolase FrmB